MTSSNLDLFQLVKKLKYEKLFIANERREIEALNRRVQILCTDLLQQSWLTGQHRLALENLARGQVICPFSSEFVTTPSDGSRDSTEHVELELIDAQKLISPKYYQSYIDLVTLLRTHPDIVGLCITTYEKERHHLNPIATGQANVSSGQVLQAIINIYGGVGGPLPGDGTLHLKLLSILAGHQIVGAESPRRVLRQGSSAFSTLYRLISETIPSSRLFLIGALHQPVTQLLSSPELLFLGTNISPTTPLSIEVSASFCNPSSNKDIASLDRTEKMAQLTKLFIESILDHIHAFPTGLAWLIKSIHSQLSQTNPEKEVNSICTDLIWALFICPAVTNPEPFGVTDAPVGTQARHTLSQVATILQALALHPWEGNDPRLTEYISFFESTCLSSILEQVLNMDGLPTEQLSAVTSLFRRTVLLPENQLQPLFAWLKECLVLLERNGKLTEIEIWPSLVKLSSGVNDSISTSTLNPLPGRSSPSPTGYRTPPNSSLVASGSSPNLSGSPSHRPSSLLSNGKAALLGRKDIKSSASTPGSMTDLQAESQKPVPVVVFPITQQGWEWVGMLPEAEVTSNSCKNGKPKTTSESTGDADSLLCGMDDGEDDEREDRNILGEKRTRFSISQDDASIGTSDNLEAVSEAASTHSVSSSIELEDQNDNFSDMMSANVSGRGTPNVSGRNTPLSQAEEPEEENLNDEDMENDGDVPMNDEEGPNPPQPIPMHIRPPNINNLNLNGPMPNPSKQARSEIDDKFCKFEIKKLFGGDETVSLVSETWSTDVLASDSEMGGEGRLLLPTDGVTMQRGHSSRVSVDASGGGESMSEAWSTDVAANDIERLHDFDAEESSSMARSDDTGVTFDTPRSSESGTSVSGAETYRGADLLLFDDMQPIGSRPVENLMSMSEPVPDSSADGPMAMEVEQERSGAYGPIPIAQGILIPEIVSSDANSASTLAGSAGPGPSLRVGAVPKTITFDKTAERGDREQGDDEPGRTKKFFRNFKIFRGRTRKSRGMDDRYDWDRDRLPDNPSIPVPKMRKSFSEDVGIPAILSGQGSTESSDDILAKYRRKPSLNDSNFSPLFSRETKSATGSCNGSAVAGGSQLVRKESLKITRTELVAEARKKLRNVLSNCDLQLFQSGTYGNGNGMDVSLINMLRVEVASAVSRADQVSAAQLQEAIRSVQQLGVDGCRKVIRHLRDDYRRRSDYVSYLTRAKQGLLSTTHYLEKATERAKHEGETYSHYLVTEWIRLRLEEQAQEVKVEQFSNEFRSRKVFDEKIELLERFLASLLDGFASNKGLNFWQVAQVENALEQHIVSKIYLHALHPNGEVDIHRDLVIKDHITRLEAVITPSHKDLRIPKSHLGECPWPPAQRELKMLSAYKTASDKLRCVVRASSLIVSLLSSSAEKPIAADDFVPVLVFVIIKSNPPALLSTIQYVNSFYGLKISGEDQYWWTQFCSAVEFIKTMDYND